jgi:hypothetical protein
MSRFLRRAVVWVAGAIVGLFVLGLIAGPRKRDQPEPNPPVAVQPAPPKPPMPEPAALPVATTTATTLSPETVKSLEEWGSRDDTKLTFDDYMKETVLLFEDSTDEMHVSSRFVVDWLNKVGRLRDVAPTKNETSIALVLKDSDRERGKKMCVRGSLLQIEKADTDVFAGLMRDGSSGEIVAFASAKSTGRLVGGSKARFCGVIVGRFTYSNAGGGVTHAVQLAGMFDLPENR